MERLVTKRVAGKSSRASFERELLILKKPAPHPPRVMVNSEKEGFECRENQHNSCPSGSATVVGARLLTLSELGL